MYNGHGDVVQIVDTAGNIVNSYDYDVWGNFITKQETIDNPIKYAGEYYDAELSMYYLRARYYDPSIGRFTSYDIEEGSITSPQDMNRYVYCRNNPIKYVDPTGMLAYPGQVHGWILNRIVSENANLSKERWLKMAWYSRGRVDLVDTTNGYIWELKPETWSRSDAEEQLKNYTSGTFMAKTLKDLDITIGIGDGYTLSGEFSQDIYDISYKYTYGGIITYTYSVNKDRLIRQLQAAGEAVSEVALEALLLALSAAAMAAGLPAPSFR